METKCPICEQIIKDPLVDCAVLEAKICWDCDYFIELGFTNYETQPPSRYYPVTWVYDRLKEITKMDFTMAKKVWEKKNN